MVLFLVFIIHCDFFSIDFSIEVHCQDDKHFEGYRMNCLDIEITSSNPKIGKFFFTQLK